MTSKRLFFRVMREDMRHRLWMLALSALASFLVFPIAWMIFRLNIRMETSVPEESYIWLVVWIRDFLTGDFILGGGVFAVCGALTAALTGFGFLFHKNQTDSRHSLPVKRDMLFGAGYLNGILVWMLPLTVGMALTGIMAGSFLTKYAGGFWVDSLLLGTVKRLCLLTVVFLLVYHLTLIAMMLSGNVLNTLIGMLIMGFGGVSLYCLWNMLCQAYLGTYFSVGGGKGAIYTSPLFSVIYLLGHSIDEMTDAGALLLNLAIALAMGAAAWLLYRKRPSELAEQGIGSKAVSTVFRMLVSVAAGVSGWLFFGALTDLRTGWTFFGAVLTGVLVFGILNVCFQMEFKAFFAHKLQMAAAVAAALAICLIFRGGLFGYDTYLPDKEEIAELGLYRADYNYRHVFYDRDSLDAMKLREPDAIYAFLERATQWEGSRFRGMTFYVRVTLKNGKTYYRAYNVDWKDKDVVWPLVTDEEYLRYAAMLSDDVTEGESVRIVLNRKDGLQKEIELTEEEKERFAAAYNQDILEHADAFLGAEGRLLTEIHLYVSENGGYRGQYEPLVYDFMENTVKQLQQMGCEEFVSLPESAKIQSLSLSLGCNVGRNVTAENLVRMAREYYLGADAAEEDGKPQEENAQGQMEGSEVSADIISVDTVAWEPSLLIADKAEIEEILRLCSYASSSRYYNVFSRQVHAVRVTGTDGRTMEFYIGEGVLPEKYILRFGELAEE